MINVCLSKFVEFKIIVLFNDNVFKIYLYLIIDVKSTDIRHDDITSDKHISSRVSIILLRKYLINILKS